LLKLNFALAAVLLMAATIAPISAAPGIASGTACSTTATAPTPAEQQQLRSLMTQYEVTGLAQTKTRYEFAAVLSKVVDRVNDLIAAGTADIVKKEDLATLQCLQAAYSVELAAVRGRVDALDARTAPLQKQPFSTTTTLSGEAITGANVPLQTAPNRVRLNYKFPLTGSDQLRIRLGGNPTAPSAVPAPRPPAPEPSDSGNFNTNNNQLIVENPFQRPGNAPLSTFSIDVDTAAYSFMRRSINAGQLPPKDAVRIEELINYFPYNYPQPQGEQPFSVTTEVAAAPWNPRHKLVQIGLKGKQLQTLQPSNLVFLVDVSGSMNGPDRLQLVQKSLRLLVNQLTPQDRVTLVVYAGNAGLVLPPTSGNEKAKILAAIDRLEAGGSTAGGAGIELAYKMAQQSFLPNGNNRVILATDGDFNVGVSSDAELDRLIEQKRERGVFLTVLGFGTGNYKDSRMEQLANKGNGNYAYIDTLLEAQKVLVNDLRGTLFTIAKDVKIQVEFNPAKVQAYRLIGYENRLLKDQDFNDDKKDAGEIGAGHSVTALYEVIPVGVPIEVRLPSVDPLKYQRPTGPTAVTNSEELMQVKLRYKAPRSSTSQLISHTILDRATPASEASPNLKFSSAVAMFGMMLRQSEFKGQSSIEAVLQLASQAKGDDREGYRAEFLRLVQLAQPLVAQQQKPAQSVRAGGRL
jgi:Ca-activated chloride channel homolog